MYVSLFLFLDYIMLVYKRQHPSFFFSVLYNFLYRFCLLFTICVDVSADSAFSSCCIQADIFRQIFPCFIFLRRVPRVLSSGRTFYRNPPEFRLLSCTVFHPAPRNSVPVFSRSQAEPRPLHRELLREHQTCGKSRSEVHLLQFHAGI